MAQIDFQHFGIYDGVAHKKKNVADVREAFADLVYKNVNGIKGHALALKIYGSEGAACYTDSEAATIRDVAGAFCLPGFIDGLEEQMDNQK